VAAAQGAFHAPQMKIEMATKAWLPEQIVAYGGIFIVRKRHPTIGNDIQCRVGESVARMFPAWGHGLTGELATFLQGFPSIG
jgi:hypothetical protein